MSAAGITVGTVLLFSVLGENTQFFYEPSVVADAAFTPASDEFRVGGLVVPGSVERGQNLLTRFAIVDFENPTATALSVIHTGVLPDLFKEDSGVVVTGRLVGNVMEASDVLAKHDENYRPKLD